MVAHSYSPVLGRQRLKGYCMFQASHWYIPNSCTEPKNDGNNINISLRNFKKFHIENSSVCG